MKLNFTQNLDKEKKSKFSVKDFIRKLTERLKRMEKEFVVDRFEDGYAVCEDRNTKEMHNIEIEKLPENVKEGSILKYKNGTYTIDEEEQEEIEERIKNKMDNLWE